MMASVKLARARGRGRGWGANSMIEAVAPLKIPRWCSRHAVWLKGSRPPTSLGMVLPSHFVYSLNAASSSSSPSAKRLARYGSVQPQLAKPWPISFSTGSVVKPHVSVRLRSGAPPTAAVAVEAAAISSSDLSIAGASVIKHKHTPVGGSPIR